MKRCWVKFLFALLVLFLALQTLYGQEYGGTFHYIVPYGISVETLDPSQTTHDNNIIVIMNIHRGLYSWDGDKNDYKLEIAESVTSSKDGKVHTYKLRDARFHNGRQVTADDVIYTYNRIVDPKNNFQPAYELGFIKGAKEVSDGKAESISGLRKIDDKTVEITLIEPHDPGYVLWRSELSIVPKEEVEKGDFASNPVGLGPFKFKSWTKGSEIILEKNPDFYIKGKPYLDKVVFKIMEDPAARDIAFQTGEIDVNLLLPAQYARWKKDPKVSKNIIEVPEMFFRGVRLNPDYTLKDGRKPFSDKRVRQAINYAIDSKLIIKKYAKGKAYTCVGFIAPTTPGFNPKGFKYTYNPKKAKKLMKAAGYKKGFPLEIVAGTSKDYGAGVIEAALPYFKAINIDVTIKKEENATCYSRYLKGDFQALLSSHAAGPDALTALQRFHSNSPRFKKRGASGLKIERFDKTFDQALAETNKAKRLALIRKANDILTEEAIFWFYNYNKAAIVCNPWVNGIKPVGVEMMYQDMQTVWVDKTSPRAKD